MNVVPTIALARLPRIAPTFSKRLAGGCAVALLGITITGAQALAHSVCYTVRAIKAEAAEAVELVEATPVFRLDVEPHSRLTSRRERRAFGHPIQKVYSAHGKYAEAPLLGEEPLEVPAIDEEPLEAIVSPGISDPVHGTVLVSNARTENGGGARMGLTRFALYEGLGIAHIECASDEASPRPSTWFCHVQQMGGVDLVLAEISLERVHPLDNKSCSNFVNPRLVF